MTHARPDVAGLDHVLAAGVVALGGAAGAAVVPVVVMGGDCSEGSALVCLRFGMLMVAAACASACVGVVASLMSRAAQPRSFGLLGRILVAGAGALMVVLVLGLWLTLVAGSRTANMAALVPMGLATGALVGAVYGPVRRQITRWRQRFQARRAS